MIWLLIACKNPSGDSPVVAESAVDSTADTHDSDSVEPEAGCGEERLSLSGEVCVLESPCTWTGGHSYEYYGMSVDAGDMDNDGRDDILIGAPGHRYDGTESNAGRIVLLNGTGVSADEPAVELFGTVAGGYLGSSVAVIGDTDGDGHRDMLVGAMGLSSTQTNEGAATLILGGPELTELVAAATWTGSIEYGRAGWDVDGADLDGDGLSELFVTGGIRDDEDDPDRGRVYVFSGSASLSGGSLDDADVAYVGQGSVEACGQDLAHGDFDGDGREDLAIGAPNGNGYDGRVWIIPGGGDETGEVAMATWDDYIDGEVTYDAFGFKLTAGDFDGDGVSELAVGAPLNDQADPSAGKVYVYSDRAQIGSFLGEYHDFQLGTGLGAGDLDGDGDDELVMGSVSAWRGLVTKGGRAYVASAEDFGEDIPVAEVDRKVHGGSVKDYIGGAFAVGDLDGDGPADLVVGGGYENFDGGYDVGTVHIFFGD